MTPQQPPLKPGDPAPPLVERAREVGSELREALRDLLAKSPGAPTRPGELAKALGVNRATASKLLGALAKTDVLEVLHLVPGPEPLRRIQRGAESLGAPTGPCSRVERAVSEFDDLIREGAGNRPALDALITSSLPGARERFELSSKYSVFKGLSQLKGAQADTWLGAAVLQPSADNAEKHDLTWLNGAAAIQRLRPGVAVRFAYRTGATATEGVSSPGSLRGPSILPLDEFCSLPPARLESHIAGETIQYTLPDELLGPKQAVDMFVVDHHPAAIARFNEPGQARRTSLIVEPALPVANLVFDVYLHEETFPGESPELLVFDTAYAGLADVNDPARDLDRTPVHESVEFLGRGIGTVHAEGIARHGPLMAHLVDRFGWDPDRFRGFRCRIAYPVYGWQVSLAFARPERRRV